jgi:small subunit ribosomal protein S14
MATKSIIERNKKRRELSEKFLNKRSLLKKSIKEIGIKFLRNDLITPQEKHELEKKRYMLVQKLSCISRNSSRTRVNNICQITGKPRSVYRRFKLCRNKIREFAAYGLIPGLIKSSW